MKRVLLFWLCFTTATQASIWVIAPAGYYLISLDSKGVPSLSPATGVTGHQILGIPNTPIPPDTPTPPNNDRWGLVVISELAANAVQGDPNRSATASKLGAAYLIIGKQVQAGKISQENLKSALTLAYSFTAGTAAKQWVSWRDATQAAYNAVEFSNAQEAGQGLIDIGLGVANTSDAAIGDGTFLKFFLETILPLILRLIEILSPDTIAATYGVVS